MSFEKLTFFGGKGGVGKTTLSCALAVHLSRRGKKTLLISTDPAHSLSDLFGVSAPQIKEVKKGLFILEIDPYGVIKEHIKRILNTIEKSLSPDTFRRVKTAIESVEDTPGTQESAIVEELSKIVLSGWHTYDHIVVDTAPTGHTIHMLRSVSGIGVWIEELIKNREKAKRLREAGSPENNSDKLLETLRERRERFSKFHRLLTSKECAFIPVLNPEKLSIEETGRMINSLSSVGVKIPFIVVNKVLPDNVEGSFLLSRKEQEKAYLSEIRERFRKYPLIEVKMRDKDVNSYEELGAVGEELERRLRS